VVASFLFLVIFDVDSLAALFFLVVLAKVLLIFILVVWLQTALRLEVLLSSVSALSTEASPCLAHFIEEIIACALLALATGLRIIIVVKDFFVLGPFLVQL
jgi:hypothetical protein